MSTFMLQSGVMKITIVIGAGVLGLTGVFLTSEAKSQQADPCARCYRINCDVRCGARHHLGAVRCSSVYAARRHVKCVTEREECFKKCREPDR